MTGSKRLALRITFSAAVVVACLAPATASATSFCVPAFHAACPNNGTNVATATLDQAMTTNATDGTADTIRVAPATVTDPVTFEPSGTDRLTIIGGGPGETRLTSASNGNVFVFNFNTANRETTVRDLSIIAPASFPDGLGSIAQSDNTTFENVELVSLNPGTTGLVVTGPLNRFSGGSISGSGSGTVSTGAQISIPGASITIERSEIDAATYAFAMDADGSAALDRSRLAADAVVVDIRSGSAGLRNSVLETNGGEAIAATTPNTGSAGVVGDHLTIVNTGGGSNAALTAENAGKPGLSEIVVTNSVVDGFTNTYQRSSAIGPGIGGASIALTHSNAPDSGQSLGPGTLNYAPSNIAANPQLGPDASLLPESPSIDAADPLDPVTVDLNGDPRPRDGDGNGSENTDQGAFERPDTFAPQTKLKGGPGSGVRKGKAKFKFKANDPGATFECKLDKARWKKCKSPRKYRGLAKGRHAFKVRASDPYGNTDKTPAKSRFRVKAA